MISAVIDSTGYTFEGDRFKPPLNKDMLKKPNLTDAEYDQHMKSMALQYKSIPSHAIEYHIRKQHDCILVDITEPSMIDWCVDRRYRLYGEPQWLTPDRRSPEFQKDFLIKKMNSALNHFPKTIKLRDILEGRMIPKLQQYVDIELNEKIYFDWLISIAENNPPIST